MKLIKHPLILVIGFFAVAFAFLQHHSSTYISDKPLELTQHNPDIHMYSSQNCKYCEIAKAFFNKHQLPFKEFDIDTSNKNLQTFYLLGGKGTPLLIVNKQIIHGYDERLIRNAL